MGDPDPLLSSLCSICNNKPYAYRCPRCFTLTCSLACVKRHKKWAQCNGKRNPGAYVEKSDLATPAGIDRDYNYLTSIERELDNAERDAISRGIQLGDEVQISNGKRKRAINLGSGLERCGAVVVRAPKGMSRSNTNATHWLKGSQCLEWTVEWIHPDGRKELGQHKDDEPISKAYSALRVKKAKKRQKVQDWGPVCKKRRADGKARHGETNQEAEDAYSTQSVAAEQKAQPNNVPVDGVDTVSSMKTAPLVSLRAGTLPVPVSATERFYLHAPSLPSRQIVLIPLKADATLSTSLRNRVVLEYPSIYVFDHDQGDVLPARFLQEGDYYKTARKERIEELEEGEIEEPRPQNMPAEDSLLGNLDQKRLMEVLGKDLITKT